MVPSFLRGHAEGPERGWGRMDSRVKDRPAWQGSSLGVSRQEAQELTRETSNSRADNLPASLVRKKVSQVG